MVDSALGAGVRLQLDEAQSRHAGLVLRLAPGDALRVFNARDGEWRARVTQKSKRALMVEIESVLRAPVSPPDLWLLFAPVKRHATDLIVEKATELGAARIQPVITARTIAETVRTERLAAIAREAAEQTERFEAPEIAPPVTLAKVLGVWDEARALIYADEAGDDEREAWGGRSGRAAPLLQALQNLSPQRGEGSEGGRAEGSASGAGALDPASPLPHPPPRWGGGKIALLIGPEGGFSPEERRMLRGLSFVTPASLGPRILRAETAVIAALAVIQAAWGDWRS
jgi:16S rRNA (uracil1498-N3)-methyltransferase